MNIFDELAESYTYNGAVSLKALEDDIVTLENQIDNFAATLKELQLRGKKPGPLAGKMRDAKIRLSLLKAVYKRESDRSTSDDIILNMLGISANNANEVETPVTAADGKEPRIQDFEESEVEVVEETVNDTESVVSEEELLDDVVTDGIEEAEEEPAGTFAQEEEDKEYKATEDSDTTDESSDAPVEDTQIEEINDDEIHGLVLGEREIHIDEGNHQVIVNDTVMTEPTEYFNPQNEPVDNITYPGEPTDNFAETILDDDDDKDYECPPPPTIDDYYDAMAISDGFYVADEDEEPVYCDENRDVEFKVTEAADEPQVTENVIEDNTPEPAFDFQIYEPYYKPVDEIYSSFDLSPYTDMVNTDSVTGAFDNRRKTLEVTFFDIRDYSVFVKLLKEKKPGLFSFLEKPKSIFMDVHERHGDEEKVYHYEFVGCRLKKLFDTRYTSKRGGTYSEATSHECTALFKYKKLKLT